MYITRKNYVKALLLCKRKKMRASCAITWKKLFPEDKIGLLENKNSILYYVVY